MIDLSNITLEQANKIECALLQLEDKIKDTVSTYKELANDETLSEKARKIMQSNHEWWEEVYNLIYNSIN